ncbi:aminoglycoside phosphotransferase family protein [Geodermatophilus obscurus]|uniref:aminoglycoside phosphotransferase family protein n=1 Tax=Geodermatophilus obscurus TaxID=1861 RepID=UPI00019B7606|nr:aminoglycoside phosphotransferase family protein [Geodermatophilus obscurus]
MTAEPSPSLQLHSWRRLDWRFLLPALGDGPVVLAGRPDEELRAALPLLGLPVHRVTSDQDWEAVGGTASLVVLIDPTPKDLGSATGACRPGASVYAEVRRSLCRLQGPWTLMGWRRAFAAAGLEEVSAHWHARTIDRSARIIPVEARGAMRHALAQHQGSWLRRILAATARAAVGVGLLPALIPEGSVVGRYPEVAEGAGKNLVERVLAENVDRLGLSAVGLGAALETAFLTPRFVTSRHVVVLVYAKGESRPRLVVKVPRQPDDSRGVRREADMMRRLAALLGPDRLRVPAVLGTVACDGLSLLVESAIRGAVLTPPQAHRHFRTVLAAGTSFIGALPVVRPAGENADWYGPAVERPLARLAEIAPLAGETAALCARTHELLAPLRSVPLPAVFEHGDLAFPNLYFGGRDTRLGVIDWERSTTSGVPGHDLVFFLQFVSESRWSASTWPAQVAAFRDAFVGPDAWAVPVLREHLRHRGVDPTSWGRLVVMTWARTSATLADRLVLDEDRDDLCPSAAVEAAVRLERETRLWRLAVELAERGELGDRAGSA